MRELLLTQLGAGMVEEKEGGEREGEWDGEGEGEAQGEGEK